jgi:hypothetical protein
MGRGIVPSKSGFLSRFFVKFLEVSGAGLASAVCAYALGQAGNWGPSAPAPAVAQVTAVTEDTMRMVRDDHALLVELVKKEAEAQKKPEQAAPAPTAAPMPTAEPTPAPAVAPKPAKPAHAVQPRRHPKPEPGTTVADAKPRPLEPKPIQAAPIQPPAPPAASDPAPKAVMPNAEAAGGRDAPPPPAATNAQDDRPLFAKLIPPWFSSAGDRRPDDVPRPPKPVGESLRSAM